jgi:hypothetical protein
VTTDQYVASEMSAELGRLFLVLIDFENNVRGNRSIYLIQNNTDRTVFRHSDEGNSLCGESTGEFRKRDKGLD